MWFRFLLLSLLVMGLSPVGAQTPELGVYGLRQQGWTLIGSETREQVLPGLPPYEELPRLLSVTTYYLEKNGQAMTCEIVYDSQHDRQHEQCAPADP
ncbi:MAG TPA: hypothetical protein DG414_04945 [Gammaproteobacteria bacterium]|nr:hypothetical protein [Gammaproteobacteria bacterium]